MISFRSSWVEQQVKERDLSRSYHLLGRYHIQSMPHFFARADVMLVTLKREPIFTLTLPGKIQSYLACGKPIIAALDGEGVGSLAQDYPVLHRMQML